MRRLPGGGVPGIMVYRIRKRFGIDRIALADDRGVIAWAGNREDLEPAGFGWNSTLDAHDRVVPFTPRSM